MNAAESDFKPLPESFYAKPTGEYIGKVEPQFSPEQNFEISLNKTSLAQSNGAALDAEFATLSSKVSTQQSRLNQTPELLNKLLSYSLNEFTKPAIL